MFRKADRERLVCVAKNLVNFMGDVEATSAVHSAKMGAKEVIWYAEIDRAKRMEEKMDALRADMDKLLAGQSQVGRNMAVSIEHYVNAVAAQLQAHKGKENGLKKSSSVRRKR